MDRCSVGTTILNILHRPIIGYIGSMSSGIMVLIVIIVDRLEIYSDALILHQCLCNSFDCYIFKALLSELNNAL